MRRSSNRVRCARRSTTVSPSTPTRHRNQYELVKETILDVAVRMFKVGGARTPVMTPGHGCGRQRVHIFPDGPRIEALPWPGEQQNLRCGRII
jgi:hypothetical protein